MEIKDNIKAFHPKTRSAWRKWLEKNQHKEDRVWLILYNKASKVPSVYQDEAVEEALCFGWIDSLAKKRDAESRYQLFSKRKPKSNWSKINRERVAKLTKLGIMTPSGQAVI